MADDDIRTDTRSVAGEQRWGFFWLLAAAVAVAALAGLRLYTPLGSGPALTFAIGRLLDEGRILFLDVWQGRPPAVFWFHNAASLFAADAQESVRVFELMWMLVFAFVLVVTLGDYVRRRWLAAVAPVAVIGSYYAFTLEAGLTAPPALAGFPLFVAAWMLSRRYPTPETTAVGHVFAGAAIAAASLFATPAVLPGLAYATAAAADVRRHAGLGWALALIFVLRRVVFGFIAAWFLVMMAFHGHGALKEMLWTTFVWPFAVPADMDARLAGLAVAAWPALLLMAPWLVLAALAVRRSGDRDEPLLTSEMTAGLVAAAVLTLFPWPDAAEDGLAWLWVPVGVLAARGVDIAIDRLGEGGRARDWSEPARALVVLLPAAATLLVAALPAATALIAARGDHGIDVEHYRRQTSPRYAALTDFAALQPTAPDAAPLFVAGDGLIYLLSGRQPALTPHPGALTGEQWSSLVAAFAATPPPQVVLAESEVPLLSMHAPDILRQLADDFRAVDGTADMTWYRRSTD